MLRVTLRATPCMMLRVMLCVTVPLAHGAVATSFTQTFHVPFSCQPPLSKSACIFDCARRLAVLVAEVYSAHYFCACKLRCSSWSCESALRALPLRENTYDFAAGAGAAAGTHFAYNFGRSCGNTLRARLLHSKVAILQPELSESSSRTFSLRTCKSSAEALRERTSCGSFSRALEMMFSENLSTRSFFSTRTAFRTPRWFRNTRF